MTDIANALSRFPRTRFLHSPTPLEPMPRLGKEIGLPNLWIKRDDCTGLAGGGNKTRKLEYVVGQALEDGADTLITTGAIQSNHARQTAGIAAKLGLECHLVLQHVVSDAPREYLNSGNILLDRLFGATIHEIGETPSGETGEDDIKSMSDEGAMIALGEQLRDAGRRPYIVSLGASSAVGSLGYAECAYEIAQQSGEAPANWVVHASGSCGTQAGLIAGFKAMASPSRVLGIGVSGETQDGRIGLVKSLTAETAAFLGYNGAIEEGDLNVDGNYVGEGYGIFGDDVRYAVSLIARTEGILIDPVYTGKALAGIIDLARKGFFKASDKVVFVHTGGWPGLFAYAGKLSNDVG